MLNKSCPNHRYTVSQLSSVSCGPSIPHFLLRLYLPDIDPLDHLRRPLLPSSSSNRFLCKLSFNRPTFSARPSSHVALVVVCCGGRMAHHKWCLGEAHRCWLVGPERRGGSAWDRREVEDMD